MFKKEADKLNKELAQRQHFNLMSRDEEHACILEEVRKIVERNHGTTHTHQSQDEADNHSKHDHGNGRNGNFVQVTNLLRNNKQ